LDLEWRAYCLVVRPAIVAHRPGLLGITVRREVEEAHRVALVLAKPLAHIRWIRPDEMWAAATAGWSLGAVSLLILRAIGQLGYWPFVLPMLGMVGAPLAWAILRLFILHEIMSER